MISICKFLGAAEKSVFGYFSASFVLEVAESIICTVNKFQVANPSNYGG